MILVIIAGLVIGYLFGLAAGERSHEHEYRRFGVNASAPEGLRMPNPVRIPYSGSSQASGRDSPPVAPQRPYYQKVRTLIEPKDRTPRKRIEAEYRRLIVSLLDKYLDFPEAATLGDITRGARQLLEPLRP